MEEDLRIVQIKLDDAIIKDVNKNGEEKLRLSILIGDKDVYVRFPLYIQWDDYVHDLAHLLLLLSQVAGNMQVTDISEMDNKTFQQWASIMSAACKYSECSKQIEKIFFEYLRPEVQDLGTEANHKEYIRKHMNISHIYTMLTSILCIEDWLKKKSTYLLTKMFPNLIQSQLNHISPKNPTAKQANSMPGQPLDLG